MSEPSDADWPNLTEWASWLYESLEQIGRDYQSTSSEPADDIDAFEGLNLKQARAAEALLLLATALRQIPLFTKSKGAAILHDVAGAFNDVVNGGSPRLFASVRPGKPGGDGTHRNYVKVWVVMSVRFLMEAHQLKAGDARNAVAEVFAAAGAKGRKGAPLSASTIKEWCDNAHPLASTTADARIHREVEHHLGGFRASPEWPGNLQDTLNWIHRIANDPLLQSKYG